MVEAAEGGGGTCGLDHFEDEEIFLPHSGLEARLLVCAACGQHASYGVISVLIKQLK